MREIVLDSNILISYLTQDVKSQYEEAKKIFEEIEKENIKAFISILVVNETIWILEKFYRLIRSLYIPKLTKTILLQNITITEIDKEILLIVLQAMEKNKLDFTDLYLLFTSGKNKIYSFDKDLKKLTKI